MYPRRLQISLVCLACVFFLSACSARLLWVGNRGSHSMEASFARFNGSETKIIQLEQPASLQLEYSVTLTKGEIVLELYQPDGQILWQKTFSGSGEGAETIKLPEAGHYLLMINGKWTSGGYQFSWIENQTTDQQKTVSLLHAAPLNIRDDIQRQEQNV